MTAHFFEKPILNSPYACPARHWELDDDGQPVAIHAMALRPKFYEHL